MATKTIYKVKGPEGGSFAIQDASGTAQMVINGTAVTATPAELNAIAGGGLSAAELGVLDGVTPGTATASKAVVLDASKGIATVTSATITTLTSPTVNATNVDAGASGAAGSVDVFPTTAAKGKVTLSASDNAGDTATTITNASQAGARTYKIPDAGANGWFAVGGAGTATATGGAATLSQLSGKITSEALTTAAGADYTLTITNTFCAAADLVFASVDNGTNTTAGIDVQRVTPGAGSIVILVRNTHASAALNGTIVVSFMVVKTA